MEILTVNEVASLLKMSKSQVYELTRERTRAGDVRENPLPVLRIGSSVRFRRADIDAWLERIAKA